MLELNKANRELKNFIIFGRINTGEKYIKNTSLEAFLKSIDKENNGEYLIKILKLLLHQQEINLNIILEEVINNYSILNFFTPYKEKNNVQNKAYYRTLYGSFEYLQNNITNELQKKIFNAISSLEQEKQILDKLIETLRLYWQKYNENNIIQQEYSNKLQEISDYFSYFFAYYITTNKWINELIQLEDFLQKKIVSLLGGSPGYYPTPIGSSTREHTILHFFIENLSNEILESLVSIFMDHNTKSIDNLKYQSLFYWDFNTTFHFIENTERTLIFKSDPYFPSNQHFWIILFHEAFHFLLMQNKKIVEEKYLLEEISLNGFLNAIHERASNIIDEIQLASGLKFYLGENVLLDIFIDSILSYLLGIPYFMALNLSSFAYDDNEFFLPTRERIWYIRLLLSAFFTLKHYDGNSLKNEKSFIETFSQLLKLYKALQIKQSFYSEYFKSIYNFEESIAFLIGSHLLELINLNQKQLNELKKEIFKEKKLLPVYINFIENYWSNILYELTNGSSK